ncbi:MAG: ATP-dependent Clp protease ATP-binding subunit ClpX [Flavobacteriales bacterium]|nr:MAG: ATP-dependent Clp protease ATP-binding subunit ClpX [Flavobacteriales bacterium]
MKTKGQRCSFCGRNSSETLMILSGLEGHICDQCTDQAHKITEKELGFSNQSIPLKNNTPGKTAKKLPKPTEIKAFLDQYVIGQDQAKKILSVAVYNHYKRLDSRKLGTENDVEIEKSNILLIGETGTGKTLLAKTLARILDVPFCIADATVLTEAGYVGDDVESILSRLLQVANYKPELAERGIIYLDEMDKISRKGDNASITRDVSGEGVQQGLLKILEGTIANVAPEGGRKHPDQKYIKLDTTNILFICGGAFDGIEKIISRRVQKNVLGFKRDANREINDKKLLSLVSPPDLRSYGIIPELIGRLPIITALDSLDRPTLKSILSDPKNAILKQYQYLFSLDGVDIEFEDAAIDFIVEIAFEHKLGARGLRGICETILQDFMYTIPGSKRKSKVLITKTIAEEKWNRLEIQRFAS